VGFDKYKFTFKFIAVKEESILLLSHITSLYHTAFIPAKIMFYYYTSQLKKNLYKMPRKNEKQGNLTCLFQKACFAFHMVSCPGSSISATLFYINTEPNNHGCKEAKSEKKRESHPITSCLVNDSLNNIWTNHG